jgi:hypothetical protein
VAATLTADGELTFFSFPIEKSEETADGDLIVYGKATDGTVDSDLQIVDPDWSGKAIQEWLDTGGNLRVQHQARRDPAGKGISVEPDPGGNGSWVKALVVEPVAKNLVRKGVLTSYSVGISHPDIKPDPSGKAMNGIISGRRDGLTKISELSLVDRGSNFNSKFQLVKAAGDGHAEFIGKMVGEGEVDEIETPITVTYSISPNPAQVAKMLNAKHGVEKRDMDPNVGGGVDRDKLPSEDFAGPNRTYPIHTPKDVHDAGTLIGHAADQDAVKAKIKAIAQRKGPDFVAQIPDSWKTEGADVAKADKPGCSTCGDSGKILEGHRTCPDCKGKKPTAEKAVENDYKPQPYDSTGEGAVEPVTCPNCGKGDAADAKYCDQCGFKLAGADGVSVKSAGVTKKAKVVCQGCGANIHAKHGFCPECGKKTKDAPPAEKTNVADLLKNHSFTCLGCDNDLDKGEKFCGSCGKKNPGFNELKKAVRAALKGAGMDSDDKKPKPPEDTDIKGTNETDDESGDNGDDSSPTEPNPADDGDDDSNDNDDDDSNKAVQKPQTVKRSKKTKKVSKANGETVTAAAGAKNVPPADDLPPHREEDGTVVATFEHDAGMPSDTTGDKAVGVNPELAVAMRYKTVGIDTELGKLHDLTCPCYDPTETSKCFPYFDLNQMDVDTWQAKAFDLAAHAPLAEAQAATKLWQNAVTLQASQPNDLQELRYEYHKAFADANPGIGSFPSPTTLDPRRFNRAYLSAGHAAPSPGQQGPNTAPLIGNDISAEDYQRGFISAGHAADSPANKGATGTPQRVFYSNLLKDNARQAMSAMHDHIAQTFPDICPMFSGSPYQSDTPPAAPKPVPVGVGSPAPRTATKVEDEARLDRLEKAVMKGLLTLDEAQAIMRQDDNGNVNKTVAPEVTKAAVLDAAAVTELVTKAVTDAVAARDEAHTAELVKLEKALKKQAKLIDNLAAEPESGGPFKGVALNLRRQEADVVQKSSAERARDNVAQMLYQDLRNNPDPSQREVAWAELQKMMNFK